MFFFCNIRKTIQNKNNLLRINNFEKKFLNFLQKLISQKIFLFIFKKFIFVYKKRRSSYIQFFNICFNDKPLYNSKN